MMRTIAEEGDHVDDALVRVDDGGAGDATRVDVAAGQGAAIDGRAQLDRHPISPVAASSEITLLPSVATITCSPTIRGCAYM